MKKIIKLLFPKAYKEIYNEGYSEGLYDYNYNTPEWSQEELDYHDEMHEEQMRWMREQEELEAWYNKDYYGE